MYIHIYATIIVKEEFMNLRGKVRGGGHRRNWREKRREDVNTVLTYEILKKLKFILIKNF